MTVFCGVPLFRHTSHLTSVEAGADAAFPTDFLGDEMDALPRFLPFAGEADGVSTIGVSWLSIKFDFDAAGLGDEIGVLD